MSDEGIARLREAFISTANSGDLDAWMALNTEDIAFLPPDEPIVKGQAAVRQWMDETYFTPYDVKLDFSFDEEEILGTTAILSGPFTQTLTPKDGSAPVAVKGKFIDIAKKGSDGSWKFSRIIFNSDAPMSS